MLAALWVTTDCNLDCFYCYEGREKAKNKMSLETADKAIDYIITKFMDQNDDTLIVNFHGGEPLLEFEVIRHIVERVNREPLLEGKKRMFGITTNSILLDDEIMNFLAKHFYYSLSVSIDGDKLSHDANRVFKNGRGSHDIVLEKSAKLLNMRSDIRARMTLTPLTLGNLFENIRFLIDMGFKNIIPVVDYFEKNWTQEHIELLYSQLSLTASYLKEHCSENADIIVGLLEELKNKKRNTPCSGGVNSINIDPDGKIYPCTYAVGNEEFLIGDISRGIDSERLANVQKFSFEKNGECDGCSHYDHCTSTRCKIINKMLTGDFNRPSVVCCAIENMKYRLHKVT